MLKTGFFDGWGLAFVKKDDFPVDGDGLDDDRDRADWKVVSHVGAAPRVAMEEIWMMMCGGEVASVLSLMGMVDRISWRPSQPKDVCFEGCAAAGFCREGALPMKAARTAEKS